ncbi:hypothetical protein DP939_01395 [Spongiactinospora rosea]|uniref:Uncharacterized protein n=1 Tax=Spongiactinospora rosea TaxID=2248750 RepID=A0A366M561_9ACTN|nr:hypothetical protein [Spongiactinospora rosea]RBQ21398.1 hypothetical protein DP939_01395 [Spongiactinospora rosea]
MPSKIHDTLNELFRERPEFAVELLRDQLGVKLPDEYPVQLVSSDFNDRPSRDFYADTVITLGHRDEQPQHGIIIEIQLQPDQDKRDSLARYAAALWLQYDCPITVAVVCPTGSVADWAAEPVVTSLRDYTLTPVAIGPKQIPAITDPSQIGDNGELGLLSIAAHGNRPEVIRAVLNGSNSLDPRHATRYYEHAYDMAPLAARKLMEEIMSSTTWPVNTPFAREHYGKGREEGELAGKASMLLEILAERGVPLSKADRERITTCTNPTLMTIWTRRCLTITSAEELFAEN